MTISERLAATFLRELGGLPPARFVEAIQGAHEEGFISRETVQLALAGYRERRAVEVVPAWADDTASDVTLYATGRAS